MPTLRQRTEHYVLRLSGLRRQGLTTLGQVSNQFELGAVTRWVTLGLIVGVLTGVMASCLYVATEFVHHLVMERLARVSAPGPAGETPIFHFEASGGPRLWVLVVGPAVVGFLSAWLVHRFAPEARGGNDGWLRAVHWERSRVRLRVAPVKLLGAALNLGGGASAGREGPVAHIGAAVGSFVARRLKLSARERRLMLLAGAAGGIGAIFRTPLGGALFVVELLYTDDFEIDALVPAVLASVVSYSLFTSLFGQTQLFATATEYHFEALQLPVYLLMAVVAGLVGVLFVTAHHGLARVFEGMKLWFPLRSAVGGLALGLLGLVHPSALGAGYGWLQESLQPSGLIPRGYDGALLLLGIVALKVVATSISTGSGAVAGVFGPSVVIGGLLGGAFGLAFQELAPSLVPEPSAFVIVGMACFVGGVTSAPISTLVMASEMTGSYELLVPIMLAQVITYTMLRRYRLYKEQLGTRKESPSHAGDYVLDVLRDVRVRDVLVPSEVVVIPRALSLAELLRRSTELEQVVFPVAGEDGTPEGLVSLETVRAYAYDDAVGRLALAADCEGPYVSVHDDESLAVALERMAASRYSQIPVVSRSEPPAFRGLISHEDLLNTYAAELRGRAAAADPPDTSRWG